MARKSGVCEFFQVLENYVSKAQYLLCTHETTLVSRGGNKAKQFTTTNLQNHIQYHKSPRNFSVHPVQAFTQNAYSVKLVTSCMKK